MEFQSRVQDLTRIRPKSAVFFLHCLAFGTERNRSQENILALAAASEQEADTPWQVRIEFARLLSRDVLRDRLQIKRSGYSPKQNYRPDR
jgi:hypothetical protein